ELGTLADPAHHRGLIATNNEAGLPLKLALTGMIEIRAAEEAIGRLVEAGEAKCPCHLAIGQEAIPVGISHSLRTTDRIFGNHRSHAQFLAAGGSIDKLMAEVLGKDAGASRGM